MPRHDLPILPARRRLAPLRRAAATAALAAAALVVGVGGYGVATTPALADAPGDRFALADLFGDADDAVERTSTGTTPSGADRELEQASRAERAALEPGLPTTAAQAQAWVDEVDSLQAVMDAQAAEEEAARVAAEEEAARVAAEEEAARVAAEEEAARVAAEEEAARVAAEEEAARVAAEEAARVAAEEEAAREQAQAAASAAAAAADPGSNRALGQSLLGAYGFGADQWPCLDKLWQKESNWNHTAQNPSSSAYGIPQSLPGRKMASAGSDWQTNPETQIRWGLGYIDAVYGNPCAAWAHSQAHNWY